MAGAPVETVIDCVDLDANLRFFRDELGWRIHLVTPADDPAEYVLEPAVGAGRVRLRRSAADIPVALRQPVGSEASDAGGPVDRVAPNGTIVTLAGDTGEFDVPAAVPSLTVTAPGGDFGVGRAGMTYRDLLPDRWGGRFVASNIRIDEGGDLADWVHFHRIRFQMIYVAAGWVDVVYEDQGEPFRMVAGDCVLQPPEIRHRVLRSSPGMEVIEVGCPAVHDTIADHALPLPNGVGDPARDFGGQRFVRHVAADAAWRPWVVTGWEMRDTGIGDATRGLAGVIVVRPSTPSASPWVRHDDEFVLLVGLHDRVTVEVDGHGPMALVGRGSLSLPPGSRWRYVDPGVAHEHLLVSLPADAVHPA